MHVLTLRLPFDVQRRVPLTPGGEFGILLLTAEELAAGPTPPLPDLRVKGEPGLETLGTNAWDVVELAGDTWLFPGWIQRLAKPQSRSGGDIVGADGEVSPFTADEELKIWAERLVARSHLGGTSFPVQDMPEGRTSWCLELEEISGLDFGNDGSLQIDLEPEKADWACGYAQRLSSTVLGRLLAARMVELLMLPTGKRSTRCIFCSTPPRQYEADGTDYGICSPKNPVFRPLFPDFEANR